MAIFGWPRHIWVTKNEMNERGLYWIRIPYTVLLGLPGVLKLTALLHPEGWTSQRESLTGLPLGAIYLLLGLLECGAAAALWIWRDHAVLAAIGYSFGLLFLGYRAADGMWGSGEPCPCLGSFSRWLPSSVAASWQQPLLTAGAFWLFFTGLWLLLRRGGSFGGRLQGWNEPASTTLVSADIRPHTSNNGFEGRFGVVAPYLIAAVLVLLVFGNANPEAALDLGGDEGVELSKITLFALKPEAVSRMWNDQPALHTWLFSTAYRHWGPVTLLPRAANAAAIILLLWSMLALMPQRTGFNGRLAVPLFFIGFGMISTLVPVTILEVPAFSLGVFSAALLLRKPAPQLGAMLVVLAGIVAGLALSIKFTAALAMAAALASHAVLHFTAPASPAASEAPQPARFKRWALELALFVPAAFLVFLLCAWFLPVHSDTMIKSHLLSQFSGKIQGPQYHLTLEKLLINMGTMLAAAGGLAFIRSRSQACALVFPCSLLMLAGIVHLIHRPWWEYYILHFAVPLAMLAGAGVDGVVRRLRASRDALPDAAGDSPPPAKPVPLAAYGLAIVALWLSFEAEKVGRQLVAIRAIGFSIKESAIVEKLNQHKDKVEWLYARHPIYSFATGVCVIPELTVLARKRFWANEISDDSILEAIRQQRPGALVLQPETELGKAEWQELLSRYYDLAVVEGTHSLYFAKGILSDPPKSLDQRLLELGL